MDLQILARIHAEVALIERYKAKIQGMVADNASKEQRGEAQAWPGSCFFEAAREIENCAIALTELGR